MDYFRDVANPPHAFIKVRPKEKSADNWNIEVYYLRCRQFFEYYKCGHEDIKENEKNDSQSMSKVSERRLQWEEALTMNHQTI